MKPHVAILKCLLPPFFRVLRNHHIHMACFVRCGFCSIFKQRLVDLGSFGDPTASCLFPRNPNLLGNPLTSIQTAIFWAVGSALLAAAVGAAATGAVAGVTSGGATGAIAGGATGTIAGGATGAIAGWATGAIAGGATGAAVDAALPLALA